nr:hypothetical protein [Candidatus Njordarchaeota archaeon]
MGKTLEVIAFKSIHKATEEAMIAYPVSEGPVVTLFEKNIKQGTMLKVKITEILSDRLVKGELL